jgi:hypothetical protein
MLFNFACVTRKCHPFPVIGGCTKSEVVQCMKLATNRTAWHSATAASFAMATYLQYHLHSCASQNRQKPFQPLKQLAPTQPLQAPFYFDTALTAVDAYSTVPHLTFNLFQTINATSIFRTFNLYVTTGPDNVYSVQLLQTAVRTTSAPAPAPNQHYKHWLIIPPKLVSMIQLLSKGAPLSC